MELRRLHAFYVRGGRVLPCRDIEQSGRGAVRRVIPIRSALVTGKDERAGYGRFDAGGAQRTTFFVEAGEPIRFDERLAEEELAGGAIEDVEHSVAICPQHCLAHL